MGLGSIIFPVLCGYWFLTNLNYTRYSVLQDSGYHVFFRSAITGLFFLMLSHIIFLVNEPFFSLIPTRWTEFAPYEEPNKLMICAVLVVSLPWILNKFHSKEQAEKRAAIHGGNLIGLLVSNSIKSQSLVELSLKNGKSYVGFARENKITALGESDVELVPIASGYRDDHTKELKITEDYLVVALEMSVERASDFSSQLEQFRVNIPMTQIVSARPFDPEVFEKFNSKRNTDRPVIQ